MKVTVPSPLRSYTNGKTEISAEGATLADVLSDIDRQYPGFVFRMVDEQRRIRPHMRVFIDNVQQQQLDVPVPSTATITIVQALSGG